jgi:hypothetical protein
MELERRSCSVPSRINAIQQLNVLVVTLACSRDGLGQRQLISHSERMTSPNGGTFSAFA